MSRCMDPIEHGGIFQLVMLVFRGVEVRMKLRMAGAHEILTG